MRALVQRVTKASVHVGNQPFGAIGQGLVVFIGIAQNDGEEDAQYIVNKVANLRIFADAQDKFNLSAQETNAQLLVVSQFTLHADTRKGRRPSFVQAAPPDQAQALFNKTLKQFQETGLKVATGRFQEHMLVEIHNDGPVTIMLDSADREKPRRS